MADIQVTDEQGVVHVFPDAATPEMIAKAMNVKPPSDTPAPMSASERDTRPLSQRMQSGSMPGSFEGKPENVGEYVPSTAGEMYGGVKDIFHGDIAKGGHRILSGAMNATLPIAPFVAATAPMMAARGIAGGVAGQHIARSGAEALGATPDQTDLAGDVGGIGGGYAGMKAPEIAAPAIRATAKAANSALQPLGNKIVQDLAPAAGSLGGFHGYLIGKGIRVLGHGVESGLRVPGERFGLPPEPPLPINEGGTVSRGSTIGATSTGSVTSPESFIGKPPTTTRPESIPAPSKFAGGNLEPANGPERGNPGVPPAPVGKYQPPERNYPARGPIQGPQQETPSPGPMRADVSRLGPPAGVGKYSPPERVPPPVRTAPIQRAPAPIETPAPQVSMADQIATAKGLGFKNLGDAIAKSGYEGWQKVIASPVEPPTASIGPIGKPTPFSPPPKGGPAEGPGIMPRPLIPPPERGSALWLQDRIDQDAARANLNYFTGKPERIGEQGQPIGNSEHFMDERVPQAVDRWYDEHPDTKTKSQRVFGGQPATVESMLDKQARETPLRTTNEGKVTSGDQPKNAIRNRARQERKK